jgi:uncharacterized membrane protein YkoI
MAMKQLGILSIAAAVLAGSGVAAKDLGSDEVTTLVKQGRILPLEKLDAAALAAHPGASIKQGAEVEQHRRGYLYEVEVTDANGVEWDLDINAATGRILKNKRD